MKKQFINTLAIVALVITAFACKGEKKNETQAMDAEDAATTTMEAAKFKVDTAASEIKWRGSKPTGSHYGTVKIDSGVVNLDGDKVSGTFLIDMTTISSDDLSGEDKTNLENHLKGTAPDKETDFFNTNKHPTAAFEVTGVTEKDGKKMMQGNLTIKDQKKNIEFPVSYSIDGDKMTLTSEPFTIDRTQWGVNYNSKSVFDNLGDKFINDDMVLEIDIVATKA